MVLLRSNVAVAIPILVVLFKLFALRLAWEAEELFKSIVAIPLELILIGVGIVVAGLARTIPFEMRYHSDTRVDLAGAVLLVVLAMVFGILYKINQHIILYFENFNVAMESVKLQISQKDFDFNTTGTPTTMKLAWGLWYLLASVLGWGVEIALSIFLLWQVFLRVG